MKNIIFLPFVHEVDLSRVGRHLGSSITSRRHQKPKSKGKLNQVSNKKKLSQQKVNTTDRIGDRKRMMNTGSLRMTGNTG